MATTITRERPDTPDARALIAELDAELENLYPIDARHGFSVDKLLAQEVAFYVIRQDGQAAACGGIKFFGNEFGELKRMYVRPAFRGRGLGKQLLEHLQELARAHGVGLLRLETGVYQYDAIAMYEKFGFYRIPPFDVYKDDPVSLCYEKKILAQPLTLESQLSASWDTNANAWTSAVRDGNIRSRRVATDAAVIHAVMQLNPRRALDVGCGEGWLTRALTERGVESVGVDDSQELIRAASSSGGGTFFTLSYTDIVADPARLKGPFDVIVCNFALLGEDLVPLLTALGLALAPNGHLVIQTVHPWIACRDLPYVDGWREERFAAFGEDTWKPMPWYFRTMNSWLSALRAAAYREIQCREPLDPDTQRPLSLVLTAAK